MVEMVIGMKIDNDCEEDDDDNIAGAADNQW